ncbi:MAG TPA: ABC transporter substrate-binding protein [Stellaceae bacterium]|jgi:ABC-type nitrate/sulfonate/bicarbonate transport system substrate-binding protein|nr:ABC transporter substrate-binding protein [Stellaceae bacterium]
MKRKATLLLVAFLTLGAPWLTGQVRADTLRGGTPAGNNFTFLPLRIGVDRGVFAQHGLDITVTDFGGGAKLQQGFVAGAVDIAVSAGTDMGFIAKGAPELAVAAMGSKPVLGLVVPYDSPLKTVDDLKGKKVGVTTVGSLTEWLMKRLMEQKHWPPNAVSLVPIGSELSNEIALVTAGQIDAVVAPPALGLQLEAQKHGRLLLKTIDPGADFLGEAIFASTALIKDHPDAVRRFLAAWFENLNWMANHKAEVVERARAYTRFSPEIESDEYDLVMPIFSHDGRFHAAALKTLQQSFIDMGTLDHAPDMSKLYTEAYLPPASQ